MEKEGESKVFKEKDGESKVFKEKDGDEGGEGVGIFHDLTMNLQFTTGSIVQNERKIK